MLRSVIWFTSLPGLVSFAVAQPGQGRPAASGNAAAKVVVVGTVQDVENQPIEFAQVALLNIADSTALTGTETDSSGHYRLQTAEPGDYFVVAGALGFQRRYIPVRLTPGPPLELAIALTPGEGIEDVQITGTRNFLRYTADGLVLVADEAPGAAGGTVLDLLRNAPGVVVDAEGNVRIRGASGTMLLLNGRNSTQTDDLESISAESVESIKIVTNPGARYDAEGGGGVIDIRLKKAQKVGTNLNLRANTGLYWNTNGGVSVNHRRKAFNVFTDYSFWRNNTTEDNTNDRFLQPEGTTLLDQDAGRESIRQSHSPRVGIDIFLGDRTTLSLESSLRTFRMEDLEEFYSVIHDSSGTAERITDRTSNRVIDFARHEHTFALKRRFKKPQQELSFYATGSFALGEIPSSVEYVATNPAGLLTDNGLQRTTGDIDRSSLVGQLDYTYPFSEAFQLETGLKYTYRHMASIYTVGNLDSASGEFVIPEGAVNDFVFDEHVAAAYVNASGTFGKFDYSVGIRWEHVEQRPLLRTTGEGVNRTITAPFPSGRLAYRPKEGHNIFASYSRRIDRPSGRQLNPYLDVADSLSIWTGNPFLEPSFINVSEIGYKYDRKKVGLYAAGFVRYNEGPIDDIIRIEGDIAFRTIENLDYELSTGGEVSLDYSPLKWLRGNVTGSVFWSRQDGTNLQADYLSEAVVSSVRASLTFTLPKDFRLQVSGFYNSPTVSAQGTRLSMYSFDATLSKECDKVPGLAFQLSGRDLSGTMRHGAQGNDGAVGFESLSTWNSRFFQVGASYRWQKGERTPRIDRKYREGDGTGGDV